MRREPGALIVAGARTVGGGLALCLLAAVAVSCGPKTEPRGPVELATPIPFGADAEPTRTAAPAEGPVARPPAIDSGAAMTLHFIDVGQGAATLIEFPCAAMLVDTGGELSPEFGFDSTRALTDYLDRFFERRTDLGRTIALLILTHPHVDHVRGIPAVLEKYKVTHVVFNGEPAFAPADEAMHVLEAFVAGGVPTRRVSVEGITSIDGLTDGVIDPIACTGVDPRIRALWGRIEKDPGWPDDRYGKNPWKNSNNHSVVTRIDFGASSALITGDLQENAIADMVSKYAAGRTLDADLYAVGHHGSRNGTTKELMDAVTPKIAVIPAGSPERKTKWTAWDHGHPRDTIVRLLLDAVSMTRPPVSEPVFRAEESTPDAWTIDKAIYSVGWSGTVVVRASATGSWSVLSGAGG